MIKSNRQVDTTDPFNKWVVLGLRNLDSFNKHVGLRLTHIVKHSWVDMTKTRHLNMNCHPYDMINTILNRVISKSKVKIWQCYKRTWLQMSCLVRCLYCTLWVPSRCPRCAHYKGPVYLMTDMYRHVKSCCTYAIILKCVSIFFNVLVLDRQEVECFLYLHIVIVCMPF